MFISTVDNGIQEARVRYDCQFSASVKFLDVPPSESESITVPDIVNGLESTPKEIVLFK